MHLNKSNSAVSIIGVTIHSTRYSGGYCGFAMLVVTVALGQR